MSISLISFGYRYGVPKADIVISAKKLPNPWRVPKLRDMTGLDDDVYNKVTGNKKTKEFIIRAIVYMSQQYSGGELVVAIGCIGGKHRSVSIVRKMHNILTDEGIDVIVRHRDIKRK